MNDKNTHISENKKRKISESEALAKRFPEARAIAVVDLKTTPSSHVSGIRKAFGSDAEVVVRKKSVILKALEKAAAAKPALSKLTEYVQAAQPALILSKIDSFKLQGKVRKAKEPARAKTGRISDKEIMVPAGDTGLPPGPAIGPLQKINLPAKIQKGKIIVEKDTVVTKAGQAVTKDVSDALLILGIEPFETQLNVLASFEGDVIYNKDVLSIDETVVFSNLVQAHSWAFNLAVEASYPTADTVEALVQKAALNAATVAYEGKVVPGESVSAILSGSA